MRRVAALLMFALLVPAAPGAAQSPAPADPPMCITLDPTATTAFADPTQFVQALLDGTARITAIVECVAPVTPEASIAPEPSEAPVDVAPVSYKKLSSRDWAKLVKAPDNYTGKGYQLWACITQFDAATGADSFRGQASNKKQAYWYTDGDNALFSGDEDQLADFVAGDIVSMNVVSAGSYSYDTQAGGNTTAPLFDVASIKRRGGDC